MARHIARGVDAIDGAESVIRQVTTPDSDTVTEGPPLAAVKDLETCDGIILGSPTRFGNMASPVQHFLEKTSSLWMSGTLAGKPAGVFTSTGSMHGGQEATLLSMMVPLLHHGMIISGIPYTESDLMTTATGGTPYGASHLAGPEGDRDLSEEEKRLCKALGCRVASLAVKLASTEENSK